MVLTLKSARGLWDIESPLLKDAHKISHVPGPKTEAVTGKDPVSDRPVDLRETPRGEGDDWSSPWGHRCGGCTLGSSFYHKAIGANKCLFGMHTPAC